MKFLSSRWGGAPLTNWVPPKYSAIHSIDSTDTQWAPRRESYMFWVVLLYNYTNVTRGKSSVKCCWIRNQDAKNTQHHKISIYPDSVVAASSMNITTCYIYPPPLLTKLVLCVIESDREYLFRDLARWMATNFKLSIREHNYKLSDSLLSNSTRRMRSQDQ